MVENVLLGPLATFAIALCLTLGPNVVMVTASAANFGFRRAVPQMLGITLGFASMTLASGLGIAGLLHAEPRLYDNVIMTPHISGWTEGMLEARAGVIAENIARTARGEVPINAVTTIR